MFLSLFPNASSWYNSIYWFAFLSVIAKGLRVAEVCFLKWSQCGRETVISITATF